MSKHLNRDRNTRAPGVRLGIATAFLVLIPQVLCATALKFRFDRVDSQGVLTARAPVRRELPPGRMIVTIQANPAGPEFPQLTFPVAPKLDNKTQTLSFEIRARRGANPVDFTVIGKFEGAEKPEVFQGSGRLDARSKVPIETGAVPSHATDLEITVGQVTAASFKVTINVKPHANAPFERRSVEVTVVQGNQKPVHFAHDQLEPFKLSSTIPRLRNEPTHVQIILKVHGEADGTKTLRYSPDLPKIVPRDDDHANPLAIVLYAELALIILLLVLLIAERKRRPELSLIRPPRPGPDQVIEGTLSMFGRGQVTIELQNLESLSGGAAVVARSRSAFDRSFSKPIKVAGDILTFKASSIPIKIELHSTTDAAPEIRVVAHVSQIGRRRVAVASVKLDFHVPATEGQNATGPGGVCAQITPQDGNAPQGRDETTADRQALETAEKDPQALTNAPETQEPPPLEPDVASLLIEVVNDWLQDESLQRSDLLRAAAARGLTVSFYAMTDIGRTASAPLGRYRFREDPAAGGWLWQPLDSGADFLAVPADSTSFVSLDVITLLGSLYEGVPLSRSRVAFVEILRACHLRRAADGDYIVMSLGSLRVQAPRGPISGGSATESTVPVRAAASVPPPPELMIQGPSKNAEVQSDVTTALYGQIESLKKALGAEESNNRGLRKELEALRQRSDAFEAKQRDVDETRQALETREKQLAARERALDEAAATIDRREQAAAKSLEEERRKVAEALLVLQRTVVLREDGPTRSAIVDGGASTATPTTEGPPAGTNSDTPAPIAALAPAAPPRPAERSSSAGVGAAMLAPRPFGWPDPGQLDAWLSAVRGEFQRAPELGSFSPTIHLDNLLRLLRALQQTILVGTVTVTLAHVFDAGKPGLYSVRPSHAEDGSGGSPASRVGNIQEGLWIQLFVAVTNRDAPETLLLFAPPGNYHPVSFASYSELVAKLPAQGPIVIDRLDAPARLRPDNAPGLFKVIDPMRVSFA